MAHRFIQTARRLVARLKLSLSAAQPTIDLSDEHFFSGLNRQFSTLDRAQRCFEEGDASGARSLVLEHFRTRTSPHFFLDHENLTTLTQNIRTHVPKEDERLRSWAENASTGDLRIYGSTTPGFSAGFRWEALPAGPGDDVLYTVRLHRFAFAPRLALARLLGASTLSTLETAVSGWMDFASGSGTERAYISNLVVVYRILALHWTLCFLSFGVNPPEEALTFDLLKIIKNDTRFLAANFGRSAANNHLLADGFGLWYASFAFPEFADAATWKKQGEKLFLDELERQFYPDGSGFEQCVHYHELGCEMAVAYLLLLRRNRITPPDWVAERTKRMLDFQLALAGPTRVPLELGDGTEDSFFPLSTNDGADVAAHHQFREFLFPANQATGVPMANSARAFWMLAGFVSPSSNSDAVDRSSFFPDGGYFVLADQTGGDRLVFRTGPAPEREVFAGHMHADPLTVYFTVRNTPLFVEAGTYTYAWNAMAQNRSWRSYFLGRESHNGLILPEEDPLGVVDKNFRPKDVSLRVASTSEGKQDVLWWVEGKIVGNGPYTGYTRGVVHVCNEYWFIYDLVPETLETANATVQFLLAPGTEVAPHDEGALDLCVGRESSRLHYTGTGVPSVITGQLDPPVGWISPSYGELLATPSIRFPLTRERTFAGFVIQARAHKTNPSPLEIELTEGWIAMRFGTERDGDVLFVSRSRDKTSSISLWDLEFTGRHAWFRRQNGRPASLRWIDGSVFRWKDGVVSDASRTSEALVAEFENDVLRVTHGERESLIVEISE